MTTDILAGEKRFKEIINSPAYLREQLRKGFLTEEEAERIKDEHVMADVMDQEKRDALEH